MSYTEEDAARDDFYDQIREELRLEIIEEFQGSRLTSYFELNRTIAEKPYKALLEARNLYTSSHYTAAFIHATIASEVILKLVFIRPLVLGVVNNEILAPVITEMVLSQTRGQFERVKDLFLALLNELAHLNFETYLRKGSKKPLLQEIFQAQKKRNLIIHQADTASKQDAEFALAIASELIESVFPQFAKELGYHIHRHFYLCRNFSCSHPKSVRRIFKRFTNNKKPYRNKSAIR